MFHVIKEKKKSRDRELHLFGEDSHCELLQECVKSIQVEEHHASVGILFNGMRLQYHGSRDVLGRRKLLFQLTRKDVTFCNYPGNQEKHFDGFMIAAPLEESIGEEGADECDVLICLHHLEFAKFHLDRSSVRFRFSEPDFVVDRFRSCLQRTILGFFGEPLLQFLKGQRRLTLVTYVGRSNSAMLSFRRAFRGVMNHMNFHTSILSFKFSVWSRNFWIVCS